jgi:hypothetical protein
MSSGNDFARTRRDTRGGPITGNRVVPSPWQKPAQGGPMLVAGDSQDTHGDRTADSLGRSEVASNDRTLECTHELMLCRPK